MMVIGPHLVALGDNNRILVLRHFKGFVGATKQVDLPIPVDSMIAGVVVKRRIVLSWKRRGNFIAVTDIDRLETKVIATEFPVLDLIIDGLVYVNTGLELVIFREVLKELQSF